MSLSMSTQKTKTFDASAIAAVKQLVRYEVEAGAGNKNAAAGGLYSALTAVKELKRDTFSYALALEPALVARALTAIMTGSLNALKDQNAPFSHLSEHPAAASFIALATSDKSEIRAIAVETYGGLVEALQQMLDDKQRGSIELYQLAYLTRVLDCATMDKLGRPLDREEFTSVLLKIAGARNGTTQCGDSTGIFALLAERCLDSNSSRSGPPLSLISWCLENAGELAPEALKTTDRLITVGLGNHNSRSKVIDLLAAQARPTEQDCISEQIAATHLARDIVSNYGSGQKATPEQTRTRAANLMKILISSRVSNALNMTLKTFKDLHEETPHEKDAKAQAFYAIYKTALELQPKEEINVAAEAEEHDSLTYYPEIDPRRPALLMRKKAWEYLTGKDNGCADFLDSAILEAAIRPTTNRNLREVASGIDALSRMGKTRSLNLLFERDPIKQAATQILQMADAERRAGGESPLDHYERLIKSLLPES